MEKIRQAGIWGTGSYVLGRIVTNDDLAAMMDTNDEWIVTRTGIHTRHIAEDGESASDMAAAAGRKALEMAGVGRDKIGFMLVATGTPDYPIPSTASIIQEKLGLTHTGAMDISSGCAGFIHGLIVARGMVSSGMVDYVLVISSEMLSRYLDWSDRSVCILFGDGASAAVVGPVSEGMGILSFDMGTDGRFWKCIHIPAGGVVKPVSEEAIRNKEIYMRMDGKKVFEWSVHRMMETAARSLEKAGLSKEEISLFLFHQANLRIIRCIAGKMGIPMDKIPIELDRLGNTGPASVGIALDEALRNGNIKKGDKVLLDAFGAGFIWSSAVIGF